MHIILIIIIIIKKIIYRDTIYDARIMHHAQTARLN